MCAKTAKITWSPLWDQTEERTPKTTSKRSSVSGFTLLELMIVMALAVAIFMIGGTAVSRVTYQRVRSTTRQFVGTVRRIRNDAILLNNIYRLAIDFEGQRWWVETQRKFELIDEEAAVEKKNQKVKISEPPPSNFALADQYFKKPSPLPSGVQFTGLLKEKEGLQNKGVAYVHFFPNGFNDQAILYINKDGAKADQAFSLWIKPTAGRVEIHDKVVQTFEDVR